MTIAEHIAAIQKDHPDLIITYYMGDHHGNIGAGACDNTCGKLYVCIPVDNWTKVNP